MQLISSNIKYKKIMKRFLKKLILFLFTNKHVKCARAHSVLLLLIYINFNLFSYSIRTPHPHFGDDFKNKTKIKLIIFDCDILYNHFQL